MDNVITVLSADITICGLALKDELADKALLFAFLLTLSSPIHEERLLSSFSHCSSSFKSMQSTLPKWNLNHQRSPFPSMMMGTIRLPSSSA